MSKTPKQQKIGAKIYHLDPHEIVRQGLIHLLENEPGLRICGESGDPAASLKDIIALKPDLLVMGLNLPGAHGLQFIKRVKSRSPGTLILVFSSNEGSLYAERCLRAGARGYIMKRETSAQLLQGIQRVLKGQIFVGEAIADILIRKNGGDAGNGKEASLDLLSNREMEVFRLIGKGFRTAEIAKDLGLSHKTIESYREKIKLKLNLSHASELLQSAIQFAQIETLHS